MSTTTTRTAAARTASAPAPPGRAHPALTWAPAALLLWAVAYGALRAYWSAGNAPEFAPLEHDLLIFTGWGPVGLVTAAALAALGLRLTRSSRVALTAAWVAVAAMTAASPLLLLDVIGGILVGLGLEFDPLSALGRFGMFIGAALLAITAVAYRRRMSGACGRCGQRETYSRRETAPAWAFAAAYIAVAGCLIRLAAQSGFYGFDELPYEQGVAVVLFDIGFMLAGTLLPLAVVHRWGRIWPRWVVGLAGRRVPRWLVLGPAFFVAVGLTVYFGLGTAQLVMDLFTGSEVAQTDGGLDSAFLWVAIPAYLVWGLGLGVAAIARLRQTRPHCKVCGA